MKKIFAVFIARNKEFYRDRAAMAWNFMFPFFIIVAFSFIFSKDKKDLFQVGFVGEKSVIESLEFAKLENIKLLPVDEPTAIDKVSRHKLDLAFEVNNDGISYWVNSTSKNGYLLEKLLVNLTKNKPVMRQEIKKNEVAYIDWVIPGIIAMNLMFNCLWGVGYIIVKYRQDGFLKRLKATPLNAYQFLMGQIFARYIISAFVTSVIFIGAKILVDFQVKGSYFHLIIAYTAGMTCLIACGLIVSARTTSKEFADGILNLISWPMMMLSGVWFSLEGASVGMQQFAYLLPLTHLVDSTRAIMVDGANLADIMPNITYMIVFSAVVIAITSFLFKWSED